VIVDIDELAGPGIKETTSVSVIAIPPIVPEMVDVPAIEDDVSVAVYVPFPLSVTAPSVPVVAESVTAEPPTVTLFPFPSFN
jgi:hypothetical protein